MLLGRNAVGRVDGGINRGIRPAAQFRALAVEQDIDEVKFVPLRFAGAQFVADEINQQRKKHHVAGKSDPRQHRPLDALEPVLVERPDDDKICDEQQQQPFDGQLAHLLAVDQCAEDAVDAPTTAQAPLLLAFT